MSKYFPKAPFPNPPKKFTWRICLFIGVVSLVSLIAGFPVFAAIVGLIDITAPLASTALAGL